MKALRLSRCGLWSLPALLAASVLILAAAPAQYLGRQQDDLLYLISSRSLAGGSGFRLITVLGSPKATLINPFFPLVLAPLGWFSYQGFGIYQAFCALLLAAVPWACWFWLRKRLDATTAVLLSCAVAASPLVLSQAGTVMSEPLFTLLAIALLALVERESLSLKEAAGAGGLLLLLTQTRLAALPFALAAICESASQKRLRQAALILSPAAAGLLAWTAWTHAATGGSLQKIEEMRLSYGGGLLRHWPAVAIDNAGFYLNALGSCLLPRSAPAAWALILGSSWALASFIGAARLFRQRRFHPAVLALAATALMHLVWPWQYQRYLIMPLPLLLWTAAEGLGQAAKPALALVLAAELVFHAPIWLSGTSWRTPEFSQTYAWLRENLKPGEALSSAMYVRDGFYAGAPSLPLLDAPDARELQEQMKKRRVRFVLAQGRLDVGLSLAPTAPMTQKLARIDKELEDTDYFEPAYRNNEEDSRVYRIK